MIEDRLIVEVKAIDKLLPVHVAQVMTYLRLSGARQGLLIKSVVLQPFSSPSIFMLKGLLHPLEALFLRAEPVV